MQVITQSTEPSNPSYFHVAYASGSFIPEGVDPIPFVLTVVILFVLFIRHLLRE